MATVRELARIALALIRLVNGLIALVAPQIIIRRFVPPSAEAPQVAVYGLRMFGIRTVLVALDLLRGGPERAHARRVAPIIHGSDLITAIFVARSGRVPVGTGPLIVAISGLNTVLAFLAMGGGKGKPVPVVVEGKR